MNCSEEEQELYRAAKAFLLSEEEQAEEYAKKLFHAATSEEVKDTAASLIFNLLMWQERFDEFSLYGIPRNQGEAAEISLYNVKDAKADLTNQIDCLDLWPSEVGWAIITVSINGYDIDLVVDTGAGITVINETTAKQCGVVLDGAVDEALEAQDAHNDKIVLPTATIDNISIGESKFSKKSCLVIPDSALDFGEVKMNGTVGWELIRQLKWVFDFGEGKVYVNSPKIENVTRNMAYDSYPLVRVLINGKQMNMGLNTGATSTMFGKSMVENISEMKQATVKTGAAGGYREDTCHKIPELEIGIGERTVRLENLSLLTDREHSSIGFFITPGILGIDIARRNILTIDYFNRHLSIQ